MLLTKLKSVAVALLVAGVFTTGAGVLAFQEARKEAIAPAKAANDPSVKKSESLPPVEKSAPPQYDMGGSMVMPGMMGGMGGGMGGMGGGMGGMGGMRMSPAMAKKRLENARRVEIAELSEKLAEGPEGKGVPEDQAIHKKLGERIAMAFPNETPLEDILKYIKSATIKDDKNPGIPIYVDPEGLKEVEKTLSSPVVIDLEGVPLKTTLRLALKQLGLAYCVKDGVLIISSVNGIYQELKESLGEDQFSPGFQ